MSLTEALLVGVKIVIVLGFLLTMAAGTVWADRRQSALVQDRVGPNRAVAYLPALAVRLLLFLPAVAAAGVVIVSFFGPAPGAEHARITTGVQLAIVAMWISLMFLSSHVRRLGPDNGPENGPENGIDAAVGSLDPRAYFYGGLTAHLVTLALVRFVPAEHYAIGMRVAGLLAGVTFMSCGLYAAAKVPDGKIGIRLAGLLHGVADPLKMIWKEDLRPKNADVALFHLAPLVAAFPALVTFAVVPFGSPMCFRDLNGSGELDFAEVGALATVIDGSGQCSRGFVTLSLQVADLNVGLLYIFGIAGTGIIGAALAGWASDNKFALLGGLRAASQMVSYEVALGLSVVGLLLIYGSVDMQRIVDWQGENAWGIFVQPLAFFLFLAALVAETKRVPFDQPEGESEIVAGYFLEYSGMKFGLFFVGEYAEFVFSSALLTTLFFGGYHLPFLHADGLHVVFGDLEIYTLVMSHAGVSLLHFVAFFAKTLLVMWAQIFIRWTLPRFRYDQLMKLGWTKLLPLALLNIVVTAAIVLAIDSAGASAVPTLELLADITHGLVALGSMLALVAVVSYMLEPPREGRFVQSSSARFAAAAGGTKPSEMQA